MIKIHNQHDVLNLNLNIFFMDNLIQRYEGKGTLIYDNSEKYVGEFKKG